MKVRFWGVRGSFATPGAAFLRYGGNTSAIELLSDAGNRVLIDLGTGATQFAKELMKGPFSQGKGSLPILLTHTHVDHIQGLPFFTPFFIRGNSIRIMGHKPQECTLEQVLQDQLNGHYSPLYGLENLAAGVEVLSQGPGSSWPVEGFEVSATLVPHGSMEVLSYRICADGKSVVVMTDVEHGSAGVTPAAIELAKDCDLLIHDAMFSDLEYQLRSGWGHSPVSSALSVAQTVSARRLALFHHSPDARDETIDAMVGQASALSEIPLFAAQEGCYFDI